MKLSTVAILTLAALAAQESVSEATPDSTSEALIDSDQTLETRNLIDSFDAIASEATPSVSTPQMLASPEFSSGVSLEASDRMIVAYHVQSSSEISKSSSLDAEKVALLLSKTWLNQLVKMSPLAPEKASPIQVAQISQISELETDFNHAITLLNSLLIVVTLLPILTMMFFGSFAV